MLKNPPQVGVKDTYLRVMRELFQVAVKKSIRKRQCGK